MGYDITIDDITVMLSIIAATAQRGAIKAEEMVITGTLYNKLKEIVDENNAAQKQHKDE